jgi:membrane protein
MTIGRGANWAIRKSPNDLSYLRRPCVAPRQRAQKFRQGAGRRNRGPRIAIPACECFKVSARKKSGFVGTWIGLFRQTFNEWLEDKAPQLGAALAYYTVFSLAPLVVLLLAIVGLIFRHDPAGAWQKLTAQMSYFLDKSVIDVVQSVAAQSSQAHKGAVAAVLGIAIALFGASGVFGQLQDALNTIWEVEAKPGAGIAGFLRTRFLSFAMVAGVCFLLLVSLTIESLLKAFSHYVQAQLPGGIVIAMAIYLLFDLAAVSFLFALIFKYLPDAEVQWRDVWVGAVMTAVFFAIGKWALGLYLGSGSAASAYGAASSLITLLLWVYYSSQILLFGAEFTQVWAQHAGRRVQPSEHAVRVETKTTPANA